MYWLRGVARVKKKGEALQKSEQDTKKIPSKDVERVYNNRRPNFIRGGDRAVPSLL